MSQDREQHIKKLEEQVRQNSMNNALLSGVYWGGLITPLAYAGINQLIGRQTYNETLFISFTGVFVGPTVAFIRERRKQKRNQYVAR